jgi:broad specificity phosphatase PhoE
MNRNIYFITHPDVQVDPLVPVPDWSLSARGLARMQAALEQPWVRELSAVYASAERKAREGAQLLADAAGLQVEIRPELGEVDRSATGYLPHAEHEATADAMFARPELSARGWETALHAQQRIVTAVQALAVADRSAGSLAIVSHGAVGALLLCQLAKWTIDRQHDQPGRGGGNYFVFNLDPERLIHGWRPI